MDNDALVAALGMDAVAAVTGYRSRVISEAGRHGLRLVAEPNTNFVEEDCAEGREVDPIEIRLRFVHCPGRAELAGRTLRWCPARGWSLSHYSANAPLSYYAGPDASPIRLVPAAPAVLDWATGAGDGPATPPVGVELDEDPEAIRRLHSFADRRDDPFSVAPDAFQPTGGDDVALAT
ncbi:hypothetical protein ACVGOW_08890 [Pseudonocardia saturnea]